MDKELLINIFTSAFYGSSWFVAHTPKFNDDERAKYITASKEEQEDWCSEDKWVHVLYNGGYIFVVDFEENKRYKLTLKMIEKGWEILIKKYPHMYASIMEEADDFYDNDAVIQCAIFGEIVFG